jgi:hypothetical protein
MDTLELNYSAVLESNTLRIPNVSFINPTRFIRFKEWQYIQF